jgi:hypothetical protein
MSFAKLNHPAMCARGLDDPQEQSRNKLRLSQPEASVLKLRICVYPNALRERGIVLLRFTQGCRKSLADAF